MGLKRSFSRLAIAAVLITPLLFGACESDSGTTPTEPTPPPGPAANIAGDWCLVERYFVNGAPNGQWFQSVRFSQVGAEVTMVATDECEYTCGKYTGTLVGLDVTLNPGNRVITFAADGNTLTGTQEISAQETHTFDGERDRCF